MQERFCFFIIIIIVVVVVAIFCFVFPLLPKLTLHTRTAIHFTRALTGAKFDVFKLNAKGEKEEFDVTEKCKDCEKDIGRFVVQCEGIAHK